MKKILTNSITTAVGMPLKSGSLDHLQAAYTEAIGEVGKAIAGSGYLPDTVYILSGLVNTGSGSNYIISAGSVFYNNEVFLVPAATFTTTGLQVPVGVITESFFSDVSADPVTFTDGTPRNVHQIRQVILQAGGSTTGIGIYTNFISTTKRLQGAIGQIIIFNWRFYGGTLSTYFNPSGLGIHPYTIGWAIANGQNFTDNMNGQFMVGYNPSDSDYITPFTSSGGAKTVTLLTSNLPTLAAATYKISLFTTVSSNQGAANNYLNQFAPAPLSGDRVGCSSLNGGQTEGNNRIAYFTEQASIGGSGTAFDKRPTFKTVLYVQRIS